MAGTQRYTSSLFVQSGSVAKFESGLEVTESIRVDGVISASGYFDLDGNEITGGVVKEFFAGTSTGVSASNPYSEDFFIELESGQLTSSNVVVHTTHSNTFDPNHYAFVKITDEFETQQSGQTSNYNTGDLNPGVHRYLVYGAQTGSGGETHQVYTTLFVKSFINQAPTLKLPTGSSVTMSIGHDETVGSLILHFTNSFDGNPTDALSFFTASKITIDPTNAGTSNASYKLAMSHSNFSGQSVNNLLLLQTSSLTKTTHDGLKPYTNTLFFTASISDYNIVSSYAVNYQNRNDEVEFEVTLKDENETINEGAGVPGVTSGSFNLHIVAPPTASISNIKVKFEQDGFTGTDTDALTHTLLYDKTESLSSASIAELHDRYTSSLIRLSTRADIIPPTDYDPSSTVTEIKIPTQSAGSDIQFENNFKFVKFVGANGGSTASFFNTSDFGGTYSPTESLGYTSFTFKPTNFTDNTQSIVIGARNSSKEDLNKTVSIRHGNNNHYEASVTSPNTLTFHNIPNIEISDIVVEVESGSYGSNVGHPNLTSSLLAGYTSSLLLSQTQSLLIDKITTGSEDASIHPQYLNYISSSVVRLRVKAKITEPFGPDHKSINFTLTGSKTDGSEQFNHLFVFNTGSTYHSSSGHNNEAKPRLVAYYTSSWVDFNFKEGVYDFTTHLASSSNAGSTIGTISTAAVSMSNYNPVLLDDLVYETENYGYAGEDNLTTSTIRKVLYGHDHKILGNSSSYADHISASSYASQSVLRMRVRGKITEPFGPATSKLDFNFLSKYSSLTPNTINDAFIINTTSSNNFVNGQLVTVFTSSLVEKTIDFSSYTNRTGNNVSTNWTLTGSVNFNSDSTNEFNGSNTLSHLNTTPSTLTIIDTPSTTIEDIVYETETHGYSGIADINTTRTILYGDPHITNETSESKTWENFPLSGSYASHSVSRFRIKAKITEPLGPLHHSSSFEEKLIDNNTLFTSSKYDFFTGSSDVFNSSSVYDSQDRLVTSYTMSFHGHVLSGSSQNDIDYLFTSGNILHNPPGENGSINVPGISSTIKVKDTPATIIENIAFETETHGYSEDVITSTTRSVLYGDPHITNEASSSTPWTNHISASSYASHSVSRFRLRAKVIEPFGYLVHTSSFEETISASGVYNTSRTFALFSGSSDVINSSTYDIQNRLVTNYTTSFHGHVLSSSIDGNASYLFTSGTVNHGPSYENGFVSTPITSSNILVKNTPKTQITDIAFETETHGYSGIVDTNTTRTVLYGDPHITNADTASVSWINHPSASSYTTHSVSRFRVRAKIIEPLGYLHHSSSFEETISASGVYNTSSKYDFFTGSSDVFDSSSAYDSQDRLITSYTTSFHGHILSSSVIDGVNYLFTSGNILHNPPGETGFTTASGTSSTITVKDTPKTQINFTPIEIETFGESNTGVNNPVGGNHGQISRAIRFDQSTTDVTSSNITTTATPVDLIASYSVTRFRTLVTITEPLGPLHHGSGIRIQFDSDNNNDVVGSLQTFSTNSSDINNSSSAYDSQDRLVSSYTSSFIGKGLNSTPSPNYWEAFVNTNLVIHNPLNENGHNYSSVDTNSKLFFTVTSSENTLKTEDIFVEVESASFGSLTGFGSDVGYHELTSSLMYGLTSSLFSNQTSSFIDQSDELASQHNSGAIIRFRIKSKTTEPFGSDSTTISASFKSPTLFSPTFSFGLLEEQPTLHNIAGGFISSSATVTTELPRIENTFTSSWIELQIPTGSFNFEPQFSIGHDGRYTLTTTSNIYTTASVTMSKTQPTQLVDLAYETEKHGYAGSGSNDVNIVTDTTRTVLYGDAHVTNATSESKSWVNHISASSYASHSVSRFRIKGRIIEPFGPATSLNDIELLTTSSHDETTYPLLEVDTKGPNPVKWIINQSYNDSGQRITVFTQSKFTNNINLTLNGSNYGGSENFIISGNVSYTPELHNSHFTKVNEYNINTPITTSVNVKDTPKTQITVTKIETETFGDSGVGISNSTEANNNQVSRSIFNSNTTLASSTGINDLFTASAVTQFRVLLDVVEPLGYLHHNTETRLRFNPENSNLNSTTFGSVQTFSTNSSDIDNSSSIYDSQDRLVSSYTSSFFGKKLGSSLPGYWEAKKHEITHAPNGENGFTETTTNSELYFVVSKSFSNVDRITVSNLKVEVEENNSGSGQFGNDRTTNVLHGLTGTETNQITNAIYNNSSKDQLVMARVMATIEEPFPFSLHNSLDITVGGFVGTETINFATNSLGHPDSLTSGPSTNQGILGNYTSSYFPILLNADGNTNTTEENAQRIKYEISASVGSPSIQTSVTPGNIILSDLSHSIIHVTGAFSSSTAITVNKNDSSNKNISSSDFGLYYVYSEDLSNNANSTILLSPSLDTTEPPLTSIDDLVFPTHLNISYTKTGFNSTITSDPANGTASIGLNEGNLEDLRATSSINLITTVTNNEEGAGFDSTTTKVSIIPAKPQSMDGDSWNAVLLDNHNTLGIGPDSFYKATLPEGLGTYKTDEATDAGTVVDNIFITKNGSSNNYNITLTTPGNFIGDHGNSNSAYGYGDTGSLVVKINGEIAVNADLSSNFESSNKKTNQTLTAYDTDGWFDGGYNFTGTYNGKGKLNLFKVGPFNEVYQDITHKGVHYPNGYQAWRGEVKITDKLRDGYNKVEFEHRISPGVTHSLNLFEWYYDDGLLDPSIGSSQTLIPSNFNSVTQSLSGISYFEKNSYFTASISNVFLNIANKTYRNKVNAIAQVTEASTINGIQLKSLDGSPSNTSSMDLGLNSDSATNGLTLSNGGLTPTTESIGSIQNILIRGIDSISNNNGLGELRKARVKIARRNNDSADSWNLDTTYDFPIGRFIDGGGFNSSATDLIEDFKNENRRLLESSMTEAYLTNNSNITSVMTGDFNSAANIVPLPELQQIVGGTLQYPITKNYNDYSGVIITQPSDYNYDTNFDTAYPTRHYYRAFQFNALNVGDTSPIEFQSIYTSNNGSGFTATNYDANSKFKLEIHYDNITGNVLQAFGLDGNNPPSTGFDSLTQIQSNTTKYIAISVRLPGAKSNNGVPSDNEPGTGFGYINNIALRSSSSPNPAGSYFYALDTSTGTIDHDSTNKIISLPGVFPSNYRIHSTNGIILIRISINSSFSGVIKKIELKPR